MSVAVVINHQFDGFIIGRFDESYLMTEVIIIMLGLRTSFSFCYCLNDFWLTLCNRESLLQLPAVLRDRDKSSSNGNLHVPA